MDVLFGKSSSNNNLIPKPQSQSGYLIYTVKVLKHAIKSALQLKSNNSHSI